MTRKRLEIMLSLAAAALLAVSSPEGLAAVEAPNPGIDDVAPVGTPVLVVNNHLYAVTVYAFDAEGERHKLGRLARSGSETFDIPEELIDRDGQVLIRVYPDAPTPGLGASVAAMPGVRTRIPVRSSAELIAFWLEPDLSKSFTEVISG